MLYFAKRLFPAYAGVIPAVVALFTPGTTFPRIRGGDPPFYRTPDQMPGFSPHTRG